ncbi:hypothetical protein [Methylobrevis pamukkalensis]|uniref:Glycosyl transferase family 8 n=1 Tax=Methylobrevis pamukkalensis TaxID=1439726 RepID=A0A1E3H5A8_9HYPH|nr:hypothetical protein [Methylobrevis pamukkalensis]ODN71503.1 hypothetical protein A6302_01192 [Methylobrevis pamukkalensis]
MGDTGHDRGAPAQSLLFFTCATGYYENFVVPYIYFAARHNKGAKFEFIVSDLKSFTAKNGAALGWLEKTLGVRPLIRDLHDLPVRSKNENALRFINTPIQTASHVYIGDVDILIFDDVMAWHQPVFDVGLPYSNIIRKGTRRLSGLHFTTWDGYYPIPPLGDLMARYKNDEELLYAIVARKGSLYDLALYRALVKGRPVHGVHMSLNRLPFSAPAERAAWGITYRYMAEFEAISRTPEFESFYETLYAGPAQILLNLIFLSRGVCDYGEDFLQAKVRR